MKNIHGLFLLLLFPSFYAYSAPISYDITWTGSNDYSMVGSFSVDDSLLGTGAIDETALQSFWIEGFQFGASVGSFNLLTDSPLLFSDIFNFNFDATSEEFIVGGLSDGPTGQDWANIPGGGFCSTTGFGFSSGSAAQALCIADRGPGLFGTIPISQSSLIATRAAVPVPAPGSLSILALGLLAFGMYRKQQSLGY